MAQGAYSLQWARVEGLRRVSSTGVAFSGRGKLCGPEILEVIIHTCIYVYIYIYIYNPANRKWASRGWGHKSEAGGPDNFFGDLFSGQILECFRMLFW